jgi:hypothetical protein
MPAFAGFIDAFAGMSAGSTGSAGSAQLSMQNNSLCLPVSAELSQVHAEVECCHSVPAKELADTASALKPGGKSCSQCQHSHTELVCALC